MHWKLAQNQRAPEEMQKVTIDALAQGIRRLLVYVGQEMAAVISEALDAGGMSSASQIDCMLSTAPSDTHECYSLTPNPL